MDLKPRIVITESQGFSPLALALLADVAEVVEADADARTLRALAAGADVLWVRLRNRIDASVMDAAPRLRIIATPTTGLNHIDVEEAARRGIRGDLAARRARAFLEGIRATAEHTIALMLSLLRHIPAAVSPRAPRRVGPRKPARQRTLRQDHRHRGLRPARPHRGPLRPRLRRLRAGLRPLRAQAARPRRAVGRAPGAARGRRHRDPAREPDRQRTGLLRPRAIPRHARGDAGSSTPRAANWWTSAR